MLLLLGALVLAGSVPAVHHESARASGPYGPYEFLVGEWEIGPEGKPAAILRVRWGPNRSYLTYSVSVVGRDGEAPHLDGVLMWNGVTKRLDMLFMLDLSASAGVQEHGTVSVDADGTLVRDITAVYSPGVRLPPRFETRAGPQGQTLRFRQTYKATGPTTAVTSIMRESDEGWVASFPGSERLEMRRKET